MKKKNSLLAGGVTFVTAAFFCQTTGGGRGPPHAGYSVEAERAAAVSRERRMEWSQLRFGWGDFRHESPPSEKIPSPAARSGYTPLSVIFCGWAHGSPVPYQAVIVAYTEFMFRSPSGSETCAKTKKPSPDWTGSIAVDE